MRIAKICNWKWITMAHGWCEKDFLQMVLIGFVQIWTGLSYLNCIIYFCMINYNSVEFCVRFGRILFCCLYFCLILTIFFSNFSFIFAVFETLSQMCIKASSRCIFSSICWILRCVNGLFFCLGNAVNLWKTTF